MNVSVYLFGEFNSGYSQYPNDYTSSIFQKFSVNAKSTTQIAIHRDGNLVYYAYIRKLKQDRYIGLCVVLNGLMLKRLDGLFSLFENTISNLVTNGKLVHFNEQGDLVTSVEKLYLNREVIGLLTESLRAGFNRFTHDCTPLPAVSYGTSKDSCKDFVVDDDQDEIIKSSYTNGYTYIYKSKDFNTAQLNSYKEVLSKSYKEKQELHAKLNALRIEHAKILKEKKQFKFVLILFVILLACCIGLFFLNDNLNLTRDALSDANKTISIQKDSLNIKSMEISNLHYEKNELYVQYKAEEAKRIEAENNLERLQKKIGNRHPLIVKSTDFNFISGYITIEYYGMIEGLAEIQVKAFNDEGDSYSNFSSIYVYKGDNTEKVYLSSRLNRNNWYSFEILKDNVILGGDRHKND